MTGIDTNILVRYLVNDDVAQHKKAAKFLKSLSPSHKGYICLVTFVEPIWVLESVYNISQEQIVEQFAVLLEAPQLSFQCREVLLSVVHSDLFKVDIADAIINKLSLAAGCGETKTFDKKAARLDGMTLL
ncbi:MAG: type II toxin-antitoxin system VapC family toxin [Coriobacteriales bacterium]|jgi:predicted nucleic-acid-binding protein|nr:type II toxin-antitoxin system VapC family toxin [Coriobacteriales bacterium]